MCWKTKGEPIRIYCCYPRRDGTFAYWQGGFAGGSKRGHGRSLRRIRTTQERRLWDREYGRARRSPTNLPNLYDDDPPRNVERCWKAQRQTQWRPVVA
jgi:hypothetical protein